MVFSLEIINAFARTLGFWYNEIMNQTENVGPKQFNGGRSISTDYAIRQNASGENGETKQKRERRILIATLVVTIAALAAIVAIGVVNNGLKKDYEQSAIGEYGEVEDDNTPYLSYDNFNILSKYVNNFNISSVTIQFNNLFLSEAELESAPEENSWTSADGYENPPNAYLATVESPETLRNVNYGQYYKMQVQISDGRGYEVYYFPDVATSMTYNGLLIRRNHPQSEKAYLYMSFLRSEGYDRNETIQMLIDWGKSLWSGAIVADTVDYFSD